MMTNDLSKQALVRAQEKAIWADVEQRGRDARMNDIQKQGVTQVDRDLAKKPTEGMGV